VTPASGRDLPTRAAHRAFRAVSRALRVRGVRETVAFRRAVARVLDMHRDLMFH